MDPGTLAGMICDEADDFLAGVTSRAETRAGIAEWLTINQPGLPPAERTEVVARAMQILEREGFLDAMPRGDGG